MLKITVIEGQRRRRVIVEGKLIGPWTAELTNACQRARTDLEDRELIVDLRSLTAISREGADVLLQLIREKVKFVCDVYTKKVLRQLSLKAHNAAAEYTDSESTSTE